MEGLKLREAAPDAPTRQLAAGGQPLSLRSTPQALALLARTHGWRCLYAGLSINYLKASCFFALFFALFLGAGVGLVVQAPLVTAGSSPSCLPASLSACPCPAGGALHSHRLHPVRHGEVGPGPAHKPVRATAPARPAGPHPAPLRQPPTTPPRKLAVPYCWRLPSLERSPCTISGGCCATPSLQRRPRHMIRRAARLHSALPRAVHTPLPRVPSVSSLILRHSLSPHATVPALSL